MIKRTLIVSATNILFQFISIIARYKYMYILINSNCINFILNFDYILMLILAYKIYFEGDVKICGNFQMVAGLYLQKLNLLKNSLKKFLTKFLNSSKKEKFKIILFVICMLIWNIFNLSIILCVAILNNTFIECLFILTSFWINKHSFGKPFHLKNVYQCFIVSNITYYILNRITTPLSISIFVPIFLGVLLSWFTSKLVKNKSKLLYKGMSEKELNDLLNKIECKTLDKQICNLYYVKRYSEIKVAAMTNYSVENIKKIKKKINDKLKESYV